MERAASFETDVLHLDMDCFYAAVEALDDRSLAGRPVIVGGLGDRGVVASASYEARVFGVRSAMPMAEARRLLPDGIYRSPRFERYSEISEDLVALLAEATPLVEPISLDEAFLDVSGAHRVLGTSEEIAWSLRRAVSERLGLKCAVGVGRSLLVAKLASKAAKPRISPPGEGLGVRVVSSVEEPSFLRAHPVRALPGVGPRTEERLSRMGVLTVGDLAKVPPERVVRVLGKAHGTTIANLARGIDGRRVNPHRPLRSIGREETFETDVSDLEVLLSRARAFADSVGERCRANGVTCRTVAIKLRFPDFSTVTRSLTLERPTDVGSVIAERAQKLLSAVDLAEGVRLLGVSASNLEHERDETRQLQLFEGDGEGPRPERAGHGEVEDALDEVRRRFGRDAVSSLSSVGLPKGAVPRPPRPPGAVADVGD